VFSRRALLRGGAAAAGAGALAAAVGRPRAAGPTSAEEVADRKLLFVVCASGGGSIIDSFLPVAMSEVGDDAIAQTINAYPDDLIVQPSGSNLRAVAPIGQYFVFANSYPLPDFLAKHHRDMAVVAHECTSVNHGIAQKRALTGAGVHGGRTITEAVAERHGAGLPLPNVNMATGGYVEPGDDPTLPAYARAEIVADPLTFALSTHGSRGLEGAPSDAALARARGLRDRLDDASPFGQTFRDAPLRRDYLTTRRDLSPALEELDLISKLMLLPADRLPAQYGLAASPLQSMLPETFGHLYEDKWEQQAALAYLLTYFGLSATATIALDFAPEFHGEDVVATPLAFDYSHSDHRIAQNVMWGRLMLVVDGLISLLQQSDYLGDPSLGKMWDRSMIYVATDFGRDKRRPAGADAWGTAHHLNNGSLFISPLLRGNAVYGGVDPKTLLTHGFDGASGAADPNDIKREGDVYSLIAQTFGVEFAGRKEMGGLLR
jgi:hypothetical protein